MKKNQHPRTEASCGTSRAVLGAPESHPDSPRRIGQTTMRSSYLHPGRTPLHPHSLKSTAQKVPLSCSLCRSSPPKHVFVLDFDGVMVDTEAEVGWRDGGQWHRQRYSGCRVAGAGAWRGKGRGGGGTPLYLFRTTHSCNSAHVLLSHTMLCVYHSLHCACITHARLCS